MYDCMYVCSLSNDMCIVVMLYMTFSVTGVAKVPHMFGDLLLTPEQEEMLIGGQGTAQGFLHTAWPWSNGIVPYQFDHHLSKLECLWLPYTS